MAECESPEGHGDASGIGNAEKKKPASQAVVKGKVNATGGEKNDKHFVEKRQMGDFRKAHSFLQAGKNGAPVKSQMEAQGNDHDITGHMMNLVGQKRGFLHSCRESMGYHEPACHDGGKGTKEQQVCKKGQFSVHVPPAPGKGSIPLPVEPGMKKEKKKENKGQRFMAEISDQPVIQKDKEGNQHPQVHSHSFIHHNLHQRTIFGFAYFLSILLYHENKNESKRHGAWPFLFSLPRESRRPVYSLVDTGGGVLYNKRNKALKSPISYTGGINGESFCKWSLFEAAYPASAVCYTFSAALKSLSFLYHPSSCHRGMAL